MQSNTFRPCPRLVVTLVSAFTSMLTSISMAHPQAAGDVDGDGRDDVIVGVEGDRVATHAGAGAAQVIFGTNNGLRFGDDVLVTQAVSGSADAAEDGDAFGRVVAVGDFNGDGFADIAVGVPLQDIGNADDAGAVHVFYGSASGPDFNNNEVWSENSTGIEGVADDNEHFGAALAVGDFDNDGFDDLAIGVPDESLSDVQPNAGVVYVLYGSNGGLDDAGSEIWNQNSPSILDVPESGDRFGTTLAVGDFDGDGFDDLAVGVPFESINTIQEAGGVNIILGGSLGLNPIGNQFFSQNTPNVDDVSEVGDHFGMSLAAGDFNGDGRDDLAIGSPNESVGTTQNAGGVNVLLGSLSGLATAGDRYLTQATPGVLETSETADGFGFALAAGDFDNDGFDDLAIGVPGESVGLVLKAGSVNVLRGGSTGLVVAGSQLWRQGVSGVDDFAELNDAFGESLCIGDFNGDGFADLIVGVPFEDIAAKNGAGAIQAIFGSSAGLRADRNQFISQDTQNAEGIAKPNDHFGGQRLDQFVLFP